MTYDGWQWWITQHEFMAVSFYYGNMIIFNGTVEFSLRNKHEIGGIPKISEHQIMSRKMCQISQFISLRRQGG